LRGTRQPAKIEPADVTNNRNSPATASKGIKQLPDQGFQASAEIALLDSLFDELFPILRSITGPGLRDSLAIVGRHMPLDIIEVASGTKVFDWTVPPEWRLRSARLTGPDGKIIVDAENFNLHVVNYSAPIDRDIDLPLLQAHLYSLPDLPTAVPYVTSYYRPSWGFCLSHAQRANLPAGTYHARIDSEFVDGSVPIGETVLHGETDAEILLTSYLCHPSMANNELSGPLVLLGLYRRLAAWPRRRFTYRFVINPETIGSLCYLYLRAEHLRKHVAAGMVLTCLGGPQPSLSYKMSRRGNTLLDELITSFAAPRKINIRRFDPTGGSDERQYCSPGFNFPMGQMARTVYGEYPGYHNSLDDKDFMSIAAIVDSIDQIEGLLSDLEIAGYFRNLSPYGEPQLGRRDLYPTVNAASTRVYSNDSLIDARTFLNHILTILNYADGTRSMLDIARQNGLHLTDCRPVIERLESVGLLKLDLPIG
jgi:aminopeptidase-like protein